MEIKTIIRSKSDEYLTHDGHTFWRFIDVGVLNWKINSGGFWRDANKEVMESLYIKMKREQKLERICQNKI